jgi:hypothetical protein
MHPWTHDKHVLNSCQHVVFAENNKCCSFRRMNIGGRILIRLGELGWERSDLLAKLPELSPQNLSQLIVRDSKRSEWDEAIAKALGVHVMWLVYGKEEGPPEIPDAQSKITKLGFKSEKERLIDEMMGLMNATDEIGCVAMLSAAREALRHRPARSRENAQ